MKIPRDVSGAHLADTLCRLWRYTRVHQVGSHIILETSEPTHQRIAIPNHDPVRLGTLVGILRTVARNKGVPRDGSQAVDCGVAWRAGRKSGSVQGIPHL